MFSWGDALHSRVTVIALLTRHRLYDMGRATVVNGIKERKIRGLREVTDLPKATELAQTPGESL